MRYIPAILICGVLVGGEADGPLLDRFNLTNGRALLGTVESETVDAYTIRLAEAGGTMVIKKEKVAIIEHGVEERPKPRVFTPEEIRAAGEAARKIAGRKEAAKVEAAEAAMTEDEKLERGVRILREEAKQAGVNVTLHMYEIISPGCSADLAFRILGGRCQELSRSEIAGITTSYYMWQNANGSSLSLMFQNGSVSLRSQFGLR